VKLSARSLNVLKEIGERERKGSTGAKLKRSRDGIARKILEPKGLVFEAQTSSGDRWFLTSVGEEVVG
jgi:hypothetical protein